MAVLGAKVKLPVAEGGADGRHVVRPTTADGGAPAEMHGAAPQRRQQPACSQMGRGKAGIRARWWNSNRCEGAGWRQTRRAHRTGRAEVTCDHARPSRRVARPVDHLLSLGLWRTEWWIEGSPCHSVRRRESSESCLGTRFRAPCDAIDCRGRWKALWPVPPSRCSAVLRHSAHSANLPQEVRCETSRSGNEAGCSGLGSYAAIGDKPAPCGHYHAI